MTDRNTESTFHLECVEQAVVHKLPETVHNISIRMKCLSWCLVASVRAIAKKNIQHDKIWCSESHWLFIYNYV